MRILIIGSDNPWRMEVAVERAMRKAGHTTLLIDDRRTKRMIGWSLTQRWAKWNARRFAPDFVFLSKCLALEPATVSSIIEGKPNAMWYHDPQWHRDLDRPDISHIASIGKLARTFFVTGFEAEWKANGLNARFLPAAGDASIRPVAPDSRFASDIAFIGTGYDTHRAEFLVKLAERFALRVWGPGWEKWREPLSWSGRPVEGRDFSAVCSSSAITLGINPARAKGGVAYTSDRTWMVMLAGMPDSDLPEAHATATIYLGASRLDDEINVEGFGIAFLEAAASGVPVVAGDSGGVRSAVRDGETGVVVPPENGEMIVNALAAFLRDEERRREFGAAGRRAVETHYNWERVARDTRAFAVGAVERWKTK